jgi:hemerythrin-like domain-containing protein
LAALLGDLRETYRRHIALEDDEIFPLAGRALSADEIARVGHEMAVRRGLDPERLPSAVRPGARRGIAPGG